MSRDYRQVLPKNPLKNLTQRLPASLCGVLGAKKKNHPGSGLPALGRHATHILIPSVLSRWLLDFKRLKHSQVRHSVSSAFNMLNNMCCHLVLMPLGLT